MLRGRSSGQPGSAIASSSSTSPSHPRTGIVSPPRGYYEEDEPRDSPGRADRDRRYNNYNYDFDAEVEPDTPGSHYSSRLHAHNGLGPRSGGGNTGVGGSGFSTPEQQEHGRGRTLASRPLNYDSADPSPSMSQTRSPRPERNTRDSHDLWDAASALSPGGAGSAAAYEYEEKGGNPSTGDSPPSRDMRGRRGSNNGNEKDRSMSRSVGAGTAGGRGLAQRRGQGMGLTIGGLSGGIMGKGKKTRLGLPQRAWLVLIALASLIMITKYAFPSETYRAPPPVQESHVHVLTPRDYLNNSATDPAPFEFCPIFGPGDAIAARRGQFELLRSRLHLGTGARVQRVLQKAMSGGAVTMSVLGGSVSACVGAGDDPISTSCYPSKFFNWWNSVFPHPANELTNGATRKTDSAYYAYCNSHHMPDKSDLVLLEFDAADPNDPEWLQHFELLVRSILVRQEMPAVIVLGHFSPQVQAQNGFAGPELLHNVVAQFYDVPHISVKGLMYEQYLRQPEYALSSYYNGPVHANADGHDLIADVLISYIMSQICSGWSTLQGHEFSVPPLGAESDGTSSGPSLLGGVGLRKGIPGQDPGDGDSSGSALKDRYEGMRVPNMRLKDLPHDVEKFREIEPFCVSASDLINPLPPSLFYGSGWHTYYPPKNAITEDRHYWYAEQPTARLRIPLKLGAGDVGIYYLQSPPDKPLGVVKCWVDDNFAGGKELHGTADVEEVIATLYMIDRGVSRGSHFVECQLQGEAGGSSPPFKILGVFTT